jgi:uncharacterized protein YbjT (DUF2867 family)
MIIVTGATGQLGHTIAERLLDLLPTDQFAACTRNPKNADDLKKRGVRIREADFAQPETLNAAFEGATQILMVSSNARAFGGDTLAQHRAAIDAAKAVGARRILYTSHMAASATSVFPPMRDHAATEEMLASSGLAWTSLRHGFYASTVLRLIGKAAETGVLLAAEDGKVSWTTHADLAEVDARIAVNEGSFDGATPPLTASEALDLTDIAAILSEISGENVARKVLSDAEQEAQLAAVGLPAGAVAMSMGLYKAARAGEFTAVDPTLAKILGRPPIGLHTFLKNALQSR